MQKHAASGLLSLLMKAFAMCGSLGSAVHSTLLLQGLQS